MKKIIIPLLLILNGFAALKAQTGVNTRNPDASANMEVSATNKGLLIPRLSVPDVTVKAPVTATPKDGLLIFNTNTLTKRTLFNWDALANNGNGSWNAHLLFKETPKTAVIGMTGGNFPALAGLPAGGQTGITSGNGNTFNIVSSGYMPNLSVGTYADSLCVRMGAGVYTLEISYLITAPAPGSGRGTVLPGTSYYNMGYFAQVRITNTNSASQAVNSRIERAAVSQINQNHRVTFITTFTLPESAINPTYTFVTRIGRRSGSSHNDQVFIIPSGSYFKLSKLK